MEERKGVHVLMHAMKALVDIHSNYNWHLLICGNRHGEKAKVSGYASRSLLRKGLSHFADTGMICRN